MWKIRTTKGSTISIAYGATFRQEIEQLYQSNEENDGDQEQEPKRSNRTAAVIAKIKIRDKIEDEEGVPTVEQNYEYLLLFAAKNGVCQKLMKPSRSAICGHWSILPKTDLIYCLCQACPY